MTVSSAYSPQEDDGDGVSVIFPVSFRFDKPADVRVTIYAVDGTPRTPAFIVSGTGDPGGSIEITNGAPLVGEKVVRERVTELVQQVNYEAGDFPSSAHERSADRLTMAAQERAALAGRTLRFGPLSPEIDAIEPVALGRTIVRTAGGFGEGPTADEIAAAQGFAVQVGLDAVATAADRVQTGLDRVATAADRVQTGLDAAATAADRVQTGLDKTATAADRVQTGLDAVATAADRVQTGLDKTATAADRVQTGLDAAATAADRVQTGLDAAATAADRVQTGLDAASVAKSSNPDFTVDPASLAPRAAINTRFGVANAPGTKEALNAAGSAPICAGRAWGNFSGDTIVARQSLNLSIARTATGEFTFTMPTAMPNATYSVQVSCNAAVGIVAMAVGVATASSFTVSFRRVDTGVAVNPTQIFVEVTG